MNIAMCTYNDYTLSQATCMYAYCKNGNFQVAKISLFLEDRGVNHIKYLISVYKALEIVKIVKISPT